MIEREYFSKKEVWRDIGQLLLIAKSLDAEVSEGAVTKSVTAQIAPDGVTIVATIEFGGKTFVDVYSVYGETIEWNDLQPVASNLV
jgi:hypothetical protein